MTPFSLLGVPLNGLTQHKRRLFVVVARCSCVNWQLIPSNHFRLLCLLTTNLLFQSFGCCTCWQLTFTNFWSIFLSTNDSLKFMVSVPLDKWPSQNRLRYLLTTNRAFKYCCTCWQLILWTACCCSSWQLTHLSSFIDLTTRSTRRTLYGTLNPVWMTSGISTDNFLPYLLYPRNQVLVPTKTIGNES